jgi:predicted permease
MKVFRKLRALFHKEKLDREMDEEMRFHLALRTAEHVKDGLSPEEARYAAQRKFGNVGLMAERGRDQRGGRWLENFAKDVRHGFRILARAPGFAATAVISLAIGIGANTAMFSIVNEVLLRPLPYPDAGRLVTLWLENQRLGIAQQTSNYGNISDWRNGARTLNGIAAYDSFSIIITSGEPRRTSGLLATPNLADVLHVRPQIGRMFTEEEAASGESIAVISHASWQHHHGGTADILGRRIEIDGRSTEIVGVMPKGFQFPDSETEVWVPYTFRNWSNAQLARGAGSWRIIARLGPNITRAEAQTELSSIAAGLARTFPATNAGLDVRLISLAEHVVGRDLRNALILLLAAVGAVLLIACSNVGNMLLARGLTRQREFALRVSLGATRSRLVAQLLVENVALCLLAAVVGGIFAWAAVDAVRVFAPANIPRLDSVKLDLRMLAFAMTLSLVSASVFSLLPAFQSTRRDPLSMLRDGARGSTEAPRGRRLRGALVVAEFALAVILLAGAGMLLRSFAHVLAVDPGFKVENVLVAPMRLSANRAAPDAISLATSVVERIAALPGVTAAAISEEVLLGERGQRTVSVEHAVSGQPAAMQMPLSSDAVTPDYFRAMGVGLRAGRFFTARDNANAPLVVIVNETLARQLWPNESAVGRRLRLGGLNTALPWVTVVGVVGDQRRQKLERLPIPQAFLPLAQLPSRAMNLIVRTVNDPTALAAAVRRTVQSVDATVPIGTITTLRQQIDRTVAPRRFHTGLLTGFATIALVLAGVGIFGLMHYSVARRTHEIGVRTALGASASQILQQILTQGLTLAGIGVAIGLVGAAALSRLFSTLLYEVSPMDPFSLAAAAGALLTLAALACFLPALRASRIDPMVALRCE